MKVLCLLMLASISAYADLPKEGGLAANWLEPPDRFAWPSTPIKAPRFEPKWVAVKDLDMKLQTGIKKYWPGRFVPGQKELDPSLPESIELAKVDLNDDGKMEVFFGVPVYGGSGGHHYQILVEEEKGYRGIGGVQGSVHVRDRKDKWCRLEVWGRGGGGVYTRVLKTYRAGEYRVDRYEIQNFDKKTVEMKELEKPNGPHE